jgi:RimJ/RimL family protein N-acetyltransferase
MTPTIALEPFSVHDIDRLMGWIPDASFLLQWAGPTFTWPLTYQQLENDIAALKPNGPHMMFKAVNGAGAVVGHIDVKAIDRNHSNAMLGRILVSPEHRGQGLGLPLVRAGLHTCFSELKLHRVALRVFAHNTAAITCYQRAGFVIEGLERQTRRAPDGTWWDAVTMAILDEDWRKATSQS